MISVTAHPPSGSEPETLKDSPPIWIVKENGIIESVSHGISQTLACGSGKWNPPPFLLLVAVLMERKLAFVMLPVAIRLIVCMLVVLSVH